MSLDAWFWTVLLSGVGCAVLAAAAIVVGHRRRAAELVVIGTAFTVASLGMAFHGLAGLRSDHSVGDIGLRTAVPAGLALVLPVLLPSWRASRWVLARWRHWIAVALVLGSVVAAADVILPGHRTGTSVALGLATVTIVMAGAVARRQWYLYRIGGRTSSLVAAVAVLVYATVGIAAQWAEPASTIGWFVVGVDAAALAVTVVALIIGLRVGSDVQQVLGPVVAHEPLALLEVGLAPEVRAFVAALRECHRTTRDHVVRTSALATRVAMRCGLNPREVRDVALGGLLHDIGKLVVPRDVLDKPGALTDAEYETVKRHPAVGADLLAKVPGLEHVADLVRSHHERPDGRGYPDGLAGEEISLAAGVVAVCDAWDAMVEDRPYREGMSADRAAAIVREGAGTQWRRDAAEALLAEVGQRARTALDPFEVLDLHVEPHADCLCAAAATTAPQQVARRS